VSKGCGCALIIAWDSNEEMWLAELQDTGTVMEFNYRQASLPFAALQVKEANYTKLIVQFQFNTIY